MVPLCFVQTVLIQLMVQAVSQYQALVCPLSSCIAGYNLSIKFVASVVYFGRIL